MAPQPSLTPFPERLTEEVLGVLQSTSSISSGKHTLSFTQLDGGNILVNCRGGRSRSVSLVALFLHKQQPHLFPTLDAAVAHIREHRELRPDEWFETPKPMLYAAARRASDWIDMVDGRKTVQSC